MQNSHARPSVSVTRRVRGTVLVIDDDELIRSVIADAVTAEGFLVEQAGDGATASPSARTSTGSTFGRPNRLLYEER